MKPWLAASALCAGVALTAPARAEEKPPLLPTRDVGIIYRLPTGSLDNAAQKLQATYADGGKRIRLDFFRFPESKFPFASWIYDGVANRLYVVRPEKREYVEQSSPGGQIPGAWLTAGMTFAKEQRMIAVAGQPCTNWEIKAVESKVNGSVACVTDEGVVLRLTSPDPKAPPQLEAVAVSYVSPPEGIFAPPTGFMRVTAW